MPPANTPRIMRNNMSSSAQLNGEPKRYRAATLTPLIATMATSAQAAMEVHAWAMASPARTTIPCHRPGAGSASRSIGSVHAVGGFLELVVKLLRRRIPGEHGLHRGGDASGGVLLFGGTEL